MKALKLILIFAVLLTTFVFASCGKDNNDKVPSDTTAASLEESTQPKEEETTPPAVDVSIFESGATQYRIVRSADASSAVVSAAVELKNAFDKAYGVNVSIRNDIIASDEDLSDYEIIVGSVDREEYAEADKLLNYNDTVIMMSGTKLIISGGSDDATAGAVKYFIENYIIGNTLVLKSDLLDMHKGEYSNVKLGGVDLSDYTLVYGLTYKGVCSEVANRIGDEYGIRIKAVRDTESSAEYEIIIGSSERSGEHSELGEDDFNVEIKDNDIHIYGGSKYALEMACARFLKNLSTGNDLSLDSVAVSYTIPDRQVYINDISKLALHWEFYHETPEWMLDFDEKYAAFYDPDGRFMPVVHRGECTYYPENSIESLISAIMLGADIVEIDVRYTKDGIPVLMHDATLTRMTNVAKLKGKNGLPDSELIENWTYDQLMQLNLRDGNGGASARLTTYKIPTLDEAIKVCANRIFIYLDTKTATNSDATPSYVKDVWPLLEKYNAYTTIVYTWRAEFSNKNYAIPIEYSKKAVAAGSKIPPAVFGKVSYASSYSLRYGFSSAASFGGNFAEESYKTFLKNNASSLKDIKGQARIFAYMYSTSPNFPENKESFEFYDEFYKAGINIGMVNKGFLACQYVAENFSPTEYEK